MWNLAFLERSCSWVSISALGALCPLLLRGAIWDSKLTLGQERQGVPGESQDFYMGESSGVTSSTSHSLSIPPRSVWVSLGEEDPMAYFPHKIAQSSLQSPCPGQPPQPWLVFEVRPSTGQLQRLSPHVPIKACPLQVLILLLLPHIQPSPGPVDSAS